MTMLDQQATEALRAVAIARGPDEGAAARAWAAMQARLVDGPPALDLDPIHAARPRTWWIAAGLAAAAAVLLAVGLAGWSAGWLAGQRARSDEQAPYTNDPSAPLAPEAAPTVAPTSRSSAGDEPPGGAGLGSAPADSAAGGPSDPAAVDPAAEAPTSAVGPSPSPSSRRTEPRRRTSPRPSAAAGKAEPSEPAVAGTTLEAELRLLGRAKAARRSGRHAEALDVLARHAEEFPAGQLAPEREYERARVLCELGRAEEARAVADAFARRHPRSPLRAKAEAVCREGDAK